jgi:hypothetical protein
MPNEDFADLRLTTKNWCMSGSGLRFQSRATLVKALYSNQARTSGRTDEPSNKQARSEHAMPVHAVHVTLPTSRRKHRRYYLVLTLIQLEDI